MIAVSQSWKAQVLQSVSVSTSSSCAFEFVEGGEYLLYLYRTPDGGYFTSRCVGDVALTKAGHALLWLKRHGAAQSS